MTGTSPIDPSLSWDLLAVAHEKFQDIDMRVTRYYMSVNRPVRARITSYQCGVVRLPV